jgi:CBS domain-containing protein
MKLREIMSRDVRCVRPDEALRSAAEVMRDLDVGALPVCDGDRLAGMITDRDIVVRGLANGYDATARVADAMTPGLVWCYEDENVDEAAKLMQERQIRRLPVLDRDKRLVGIVSLGDMAVRAHDDRLSGKTLEQVSEPVG